MISDDAFDMEMLEDGHIYFLNTQKLSKSSNLTKHSDGRQYTIWETLANTVREKADRLYFIIDEAHRGAQGARDLTKNTTIMQKFLKGSDADNLPPMPVVIGMTATPQRFNRLAEGIQSTTHYVKTTADEVRASGLLKDRIVITYPEHAGNDMAVLQAATDEWKSKWDHWYQYCYEQHYGQVNPIFVIQVQKGMWAGLEGRHIALWQREKESYLASIQSTANYKLESISSNYRNRKRTLEQKIRDAFEEKIRRMYQSELNTATEKYQVKVAEINDRACVTS